MSGIGNIGAKSLIQHLRPAAGAEAIAKTEAAAAPKTLSPAKAAAQERFRALQDTNVMVVLPADSKALAAMFSTGKLEQGNLFLHNVDGVTHNQHGMAALVLSDEGKKALSTASALDPLLQNRPSGFGSGMDLPAALDLRRHIQEVVIDDLAYPAVVKAFEEGGAQGALPKMIGGKPPAQFFRPSDDFLNDFQVEQFRKDVPGFAQKPLIEQKAIAALAGAVSKGFPVSVPAAIRHRVAASMVTHKAYDTPIKTDGLDVVGEVRDFFHGRQIIGRDGSPLRTPETLLDEGFHPDEKGAYGVGVYHANGSVAQAYGLSKVSLPGSIISGKVALGNMAPEHVSKMAFDADVTIHSSRALGRDLGDYWVTKDPQRFFVTGITRYDPASTGFAKVIPDLLQSVLLAPEWAIQKLLTLDPAQLQRALAHASKSGDPALNQSATLVRATQGDHSARLEALKLLKSANPSIRAASATALKSSILAMETTQLSEAKEIAQALFRTSLNTRMDHEFIIKLEDRFGTAVFGALELEGANQALLKLAPTASEQKIKNFLELADNVNYQDSRGSALHHAAFAGNMDAVNALIAAGLNLEAMGGGTALHMAAHGGHLPVIDALISAGANVNATNITTDTAIHILIQSKTWNSGAFNSLIKAGADINAKNQLGATPLHIAARDNLPDAVKNLIDAGADLEARNGRGLTALDIAHDYNSQAVIKVFTEAALTP